MSVATLDRDRLTPTGVVRSGRAVWARRIAFALPVAALGWLGWAIVRPLPQPDVDPAPAPQPAVGLPLRGRPMAERESDLRALASENLFAPERRPWSVPVGDRPDGSEALASGAASSTGSAAPSAPGSSQSAQSASRSRRPGDAAVPTGGGTGKLKGLTLRGVYNLGAGPVAIIERIGGPEGPRTESLAVGQAFSDGAWEVIGVDESRDEVTLRGDSGEHVLQMYGDSARLSARQPVSEAGPDTVSAPVTSAGPKVVHRTAAELRAELARSGLTAVEVEELMLLAQQDTEAAALQAAVERAGVDGASPAPDGAQTPAGLGSILQLMKGDPFGADSEVRPSPDAEEEARTRRERARRMHDKPKSGAPSS